MKITKEIITVNNTKKLPNGAVINRFSHVCEGAEIGENCMIGEHCYIGADAIIGAECRIQNHVNIWNGVEIGRKVFVGPMTCFTNRKYPNLVKKTSDIDYTTIGDNVIIGANSTILPVCISDNVTIGAGSLILRDIDNGLTVYGIVK